MDSCPRRSYLRDHRPSTEEVLATVARGGTGDVDDAVAAARAAFEGPWRRVTPPERGRLLYRVARELEARIDEFAELETLDTGKPLAHARGEISGCVGYLDYYAGMADKIHGETIPLGPDYLNYTVREPLGVTAHIVPWNMPSTWSAAASSRLSPPETPPS